MTIHRNWAPSTELRAHLANCVAAAFPPGHPVEDYTPQLQSGSRPLNAYEHSLKVHLEFAHGVRIDGPTFNAIDEYLRVTLGPNIAATWNGEGFDMDRGIERLAAFISQLTRTWIQP